MSHHGYNPLNDKQGEILRSIFAKQDGEMRKAIFPDGKLNHNDEGVLAFGVGLEGGKVVIHFAEPTAWMGMTPDQAAELAAVLLKHARTAGLTKPAVLTL